MMEGFKIFYEQTKEQKNNIRSTLERIPKKHKILIRGYKLKWHHDNTLPGDREHVGLINPINKTITVAAPYRYSREFTFLHELGHKVWEVFVLPYPELVKEWKKIVKKTKDKLHQNAEELFCHGYAGTYAEHPPMVHHHEEWIKFIKKL